MNKKLLVLPTLLLLVAPLASCDNGGGDSSTIEVIFGHTFGDKVETAIKKKIDKFVKLIKDNEGVDVKVTLDYLGGYKDVTTKVTTYFANGTHPTMTIAYPDSVADFLYNIDIGSKNVVNLDDFMNDPELAFGADAYLGDGPKSDYVPAFLEEGKQFAVTGTYSMPFMKSSEIMLYNLDAVTEAMRFYDNSVVEQGKVREKIASFTWDELLAFARVAKAHKEKVSTNLTYPISYDSDSNLFITQMYQEGYQYSSIKNGAGNIDFDDNTYDDEGKLVEGPNYAGAKSLLQDYLDWHDEGIFTTGGTLGTYGSTAFKNGEVIFTIGSSGGSGYNFPQAGEFTVGICKVPARNNKPYYISQGPCITILRNPTLSKAVDEARIKYAWKFYKYITSKQVNVELCVTGSEGYSPVRTSSYGTETYLTFMEEGGNYADAAKVLTDDINGKYISSAIFHGSKSLRDYSGGAVTNVLSGISTIEDALSVVINNTKKDMSGTEE